MDKEKIIQRIYAKVEEIPTLSPLLHKIIITADSDSSNADDLTEIIARDPSLTSKILKVANSAYYGFQHKVGTLDRAVVLLGFNMIRSLALSVGIIRTLQSRDKTKNFSRERLWIHSLAVATLMKEMADRSGRKEDGETLFVGGLLHDIGKVVLDQFFAEEYQQVMEDTGCLESVSVCEEEIRHFGIDHGDVGSILLKRWNFPEAICALVTMDHKTDVPEGIKTSDVAMLHIADILSKEAGLGVSESITPAEFNMNDLEALGITDKELVELRAFMTEAKDGIYAFYNSLG